MYIYIYIYILYTLLINKQTITNRWINEWGIQIASERRMSRE